MARVRLDTSSDTRGVQRLNTELAKSEKELEDLAKASRGVTGQKRKWEEMADPVKRVDREFAKLAVDVKKLGISEEVAEKAAAKLQRRMDRLSGSTKQAVGPDVVGNVKSMVGGYLSVAGAVGTVTKALSEMEQQAQAAADATFSGLGSIGELQQISDSPEAFQKNLGFARSLVSRGVFKEVGAAADATFSLSSAGFTDSEKQFLAGLAEKKLIKGEGLVGFGGALRKSQGLFPGGISVQDITDRILATSNETQANATQTALATSQFGAASAQLGFKGDATLAGLVLIEEQAKNIDEAATQMGNLLDAIDQKRLSKGSFKATIAGIQSQIDGGAGAFDVLGNKRAVKGFRAIQSQIGAFDSQLARISGSAGTANAASYIDVDPITRSGAARELAEGRRLAAQDSLTTSRENVVAAVKEDTRAYYLERGQETSATIAGFLQGVMDRFGGDNSIIGAGLHGGALSPETRASAAQYILDNDLARSQNLTTDYLRRIAEGVEGGNVGGRQE